MCVSCAEVVRGAGRSAVDRVGRSNPSLARSPIEIDRLPARRVWLTGLDAPIPPEGARSNSCREWLLIRKFECRLEPMTLLAGRVLPAARASSSVPMPTNSASKTGKLPRLCPLLTRVGRTLLESPFPSHNDTRNCSPAHKLMQNDSSEDDVGHKLH